MNNQIENSNNQDKSADKNTDSYDYTFVETVARIAQYDDLMSAPRVTEIQPATTAEFIENLASKIYEQAKMAGGTIPYTVIREVSENFIHARFTEIIVSILDDGNTIRFADQGPGINHKEKAQLPGFTSAIEPMKHYIRGVGSGLPIVKEYLDFSHGTISIEDNLGTGAVVTISLKNKAEQAAVPPYGGFQAGGHPMPGYQPQPSYQAQYAPQQANQYGIPVQQPMPNRPGALIPPLSQKEKEFLPIFLNEGALGVTDLSRITGVPASSTYVALSKMEEAGLIEKTVGQKRILTDLGFHVANSL